MADRKYYVFCADNCKFEGMTKEQILTAIEQAVSTGEIKDVDTGFVTKIKECNKNTALTFWIGTQAEYNALTEITENCFYIVTDDTSGADFDAAFADIIERVNALEKNKPRKLTKYNPVVGTTIPNIFDYEILMTTIGLYGNANEVPIFLKLGAWNEDEKKYMYEGAATGFDPRNNYECLSFKLSFVVDENGTVTSLKKYINGESKIPAEMTGETEEEIAKWQNFGISALYGIC